MWQLLALAGTVVVKSCLKLLNERVLSPSERLQLVGRSEPASAGKLYGMRTDLSECLC